MKNKFMFKWLHGSPNQTGKTLTRENWLGIVTCLIPARFLLTCILLLGVGQMWANNYIEGDAGLITTGWNKTGYRIDNTPYNNYAVAAGQYNFKITDGSNESGGSCFGTVTGVTSSNYGVTNGCMWIKLTGINDVNITWANSGWNVNITVTPSSYFIKYPWGNNHAWTFSAPMTACSDGTYACTGPYNGTTYDFGRRGYDGGAGAKTGQTATVNNSPSTDETCVFNVTTSGALTITRCNKVTATNKIYFDNSVSNFTGNIYLIIGHDKPTKYSCAYKMTQLAGTKLHYVSVGANWTDATYYAIVGNSAASISAGSWGSESLSTKQTGGYTAAYTGKYDLDGSNKQYLFTTASSGNGQALTITYKNTSYSNLNYTQSVNQELSTDAGSSYSTSTASIATISVSSMMLNGNSSTTSSSGTISSGNSSATCSAARTATVTYSVSSVNSGYHFVGWYDGSTQKSTNTTYTYNAMEAKTITARFIKLKTITIKFVHEATEGWTIQGVTKYPTSGGQSISANGTWVTMTFTNVYAVSNIDLAYAGGGEWDNLNTSTKITDDCCYNKDGSLNVNCCVSAPSLTWTTAPANGNVGDNMTAVVNTTPVSGGSPSVTWSTSNSSIANVNSSTGEISYVAAGSATITAHVTWSAIGDYCAGSQDLAQAITVSTPITPSITAASFTNTPIYTWEWVKIDFTYANIPEGAYYKIKGGGGYYRNKNNLVNIPISGNGTANFEAACDQVNMINGQTWVVEIYNSSNTKITERTVGNLSVTSQEAVLGSITLSPNTTQNYAGSPIDITMSVTSTYLPNPVVIFYVTDNSNSTTYEVVATTGAIGLRPDYETTHTATFAASHAATYSVTAKVFAGLLLANWDGKDFSGGGGWFNNNGGHAKVANPAIQANNASATVQSFTKGTNWWDVPLYWLTTTDADKTGYNYRYIHTRQYSAQSGKPELKVSNYKGNLTTGDSFSANQWCKLTYDNYKDGSERVDFFMPLFENGNTTVYIDDIILSNEASMTARATQSTAASVTIRDVYNITYLDEGGASFSGIHEDTPSEHPTTHTYGTATTLKIPTKTGYTFGGWYTTSACTGEAVTSLGATAYSDDITLYAKWTANTYTVTFNARGGSDLTPTSKEVTMGAAYGTLATVTPPAGYVFDGWYTSSAGGTKVTAETLVETASDHTLYAHYAVKKQVYFKNTLGWDKVYVTYDAYWVDGSNKGAGNNGKTYHKMKLVAGTTDVYYDDIPDAILTNWKWYIAFDNSGFCDAAQKENPTTGTSQEFYGGEAVFRYDFDSIATMFVPTSNTNANEDGNFNDVNSTQYRSTGYTNKNTSDPNYTSGYWRTYNNTYSGYTMTYQKSTEGSTWHGGNKLIGVNGTTNTFIYTLTLDANSTYYFSMYKQHAENNRTLQFGRSYTVKYNYCTDIKLESKASNLTLNTTAAGEYIFKLELKEDGHMYLSVEYPVRANDYRVVYTWNDGSAHTYNSEIIRAAAGTDDTISVFVHKSTNVSSQSLEIQKCISISDGTVSWSSVNTITLPTASITENGVYDFIITQPASGNPTGAYYDKYTGNYYIRTDASDGGWDMYKYRPNNIMTLSEYSLTQTLSDPFSHYYCRFIGSTSVDITYAVATDYSPNISGTMTGDATIGVGSTTLPATANVRFSWNEKTNAMRRAYLKNAQGENSRYLVLHGADNKIRNNDATGTEITPSGDLVANELLFTDIGNWVYQVELKAIPGAKVSLIANYNSADRYLVGDGDTKWETIIGGSGLSPYSIKAVYDFKTNRLMTVWTPNGVINQALTDVDVLLIRHAQEAGKSIRFDAGGSLNTKKVYGAIELRYNELVGFVADWTTTSRPLLKYMISFPFNVNISDIFGLNSRYGEAYIIQKYDGADRAARGFFRGDGTTTFWKTMAQNDVLEANVGYSVIFDNDYLNGDLGAIWENKSTGSSVYLYFPSVGNVGSITSTSKTIKVPEHKCEIDRTFTSAQAGDRELNHKNTDSNWNMMGVPIFNNHSDNGTTGQPGAVFADSYGADDAFNYFYEWSSATNQYGVHTAKNYEFKSMHGYMVQYHGDVTFKTAATPAAVAARRMSDKEYQVELQVLGNEKEILNRTYVELRANACDTFALNEDVYMNYNSQAVNIYTLAGNYDVAANVLSIDNHIVPVGVEVSKAGTYTFSMPSDFDGTVVLVDNFDGSRTDLSLGDYSVALPKGTIEDRFTLEINIERSSATDIEGIEGGDIKDGKAHKFVRDGIMYILRDGVIYDAMGKRVK